MKYGAASRVEARRCVEHPGRCGIPARFRRGSSSRHHRRHRRKPAEAKSRPKDTDQRKEQVHRELGWQAPQRSVHRAGVGKPLEDARQVVDGAERDVGEVGHQVRIGEVRGQGQRRHQRPENQRRERHHRRQRGEDSQLAWRNSEMSSDRTASWRHQEATDHEEDLHPERSRPELPPEDPIRESLSDERDRRSRPPPRSASPSRSCSRGGSGERLAHRRRIRMLPPGFSRQRGKSRSNRGRWCSSRKELKSTISKSELN